HNGAGKSTLLKAILGTLPKSAGKVIINETYDQDESFLTFKQMVSYLPEEPLLLTELTMMQHFQLYGKSYQIAEKRLYERLERLVEGFNHAIAPASKSPQRVVRVFRIIASRLFDNKHK